MKLKIAVSHEYLTFFGGAERVLLDILATFPNADLYTLTYNPRCLPAWVNRKLSKHQIFVSPLKKWQKISPLTRFWAPYAVESFDFSKYEVVISNTNSYAKGAITPTDTLHVAYIHSPTRYLWDYAHPYLKEHASNRASLALLRLAFLSLRRWDFIAAQRPDMLLANSFNVKKRIKKYYRRRAKILYPAIKIDKYYPAAKKDYFLVVSRLSPYKTVDLAVRTFLELKDFKLKIAGEGTELKRLKKMATKANNIEFLGFVPEKKIKKLYAEALAVIFPQEEDFGLVPLEAMASGTPVIAYQKGGALEIINLKTGVFFKEQTESSLKEAIRQFWQRRDSFKTEVLIKQTKKFDLPRFRYQLKEAVYTSFASHRSHFSRNTAIK